MSALLLILAASAIIQPAPEDERGCLASAIAYEAGLEPIDGQRAVAEVVLNRLGRRGYPKTICGVVFEGSTRRTGCQFSFTCDGSLHRRLTAAILASSRAVAEEAIDGRMPQRLGGATHYHADYVNPGWAGRLERVTQIGAHIFYRAPSSKLVHAAAVGSGNPAPRQPSTDPAPFAPWGLTMAGPAS